MQNDMIKKELDELVVFGQEIINLLEAEIKQKDNEIVMLQNNYENVQGKFNRMKQNLQNLLND